jgi:heptosyltransferase-2
MNHLPELVKRVVVRSPNWLGDAVMTLPAIKLLSDSLTSDTELYILCKPNLIDFWKTVPGIKQILPVDQSFLKTAQTLREINPTTVIVLPNSWRTALEAFFSGSKKRYGYKSGLRELLFNQSWSKVSSSKIRHQSLDYLQLMNNLGCEWDGGTISLPTLNKPENLSPQKPYIVVCPGAEYGPAKRWLSDRYAGVIRSLKKEMDFDVYILGGPKDELAASEVFRGIGDESVKNLTGKTKMEEFIAYIAHASLVLCNDSGAMHLSSAFGTHGVAIFGSTEDQLTGPLHRNMAVVREKVECSPCFLRECPIDFRCMVRVEEERVYTIAVQKLKTVLLSKN